MKVEFNYFEAKCASMKLRGVSPETIAEVMQSERKHEVSVDLVNDVLKRVGEKLRRELKN